MSMANSYMTAPVTTTSTTYANRRNRRFSNSKSNVRSIEQRWNETLAALPQSMQDLINDRLDQAVAEFKRRNPLLKTWKSLKLAEAKDAILGQIMVDATMQRQLDPFWVLELIERFMATMVVPIQVYRPVQGKDEFLAWDGQHTLVMLWLISTHIFENDPNTIEIPVNVYQSSLKAEMRTNFISLNSKEGKKQLEAIDIFEQQVFGVRIDGATNKEWVDTEKKQQYIERAGLFVTAKKFGDYDQPGAISRLQEINKMTPDLVDYLCKYLAASTQLNRPVEEKEIVMISYYLQQCVISKINLSDQYVKDLAATARTLWNADFSPSGKFWIRVTNAYHRWHNKNGNPYADARCNKEPVHGYPFMIAQLKKSFNHPVPTTGVKTSFWPDTTDLF